MVTILQATKDDHQTVVRDLFREYFQWLCSWIHREYGATVDAEALLEHDIADLPVFFPPHGRLLLAYDDMMVAGCSCVRAIGPRTAESQRMYVRPAFRRRGIGRALVEAAISEARAAGYSNLRLASADFMRDAHALYRQAGFHEIAPYSECEIPVEFRVRYLFMEQSLNRQTDRASKQIQTQEKE